MGVGTTQEGAQITVRAPVLPQHEPRGQSKVMPVRSKVPSKRWLEKEGEERKEERKKKIKEKTKPRPSQIQSGKGPANPLESLRSLKTKQKEERKQKRTGSVKKRGKFFFVFVFVFVFVSKVKKNRGSQIR